LGIQITDNRNGTFEELHVSEGTADSGDFTYWVGRGGTLTLSVESEPPFHGVISSDGNRLTLAQTGADEAGLFFGIRKSSSTPGVQAQDVYLASQFEDSETENGPQAALLSLTINDSDDGTVEELYVSDGDDLGSTTFEYTLGTDGTLTVTPLGGETLNGIMSSDGECFCLVGTAGDKPEILVGVRKSSGMSNAKAKGSYLMSQYDDDEGVSENDPWAGLVAVAMDGIGGGSARELYRSGTGSPDSGTFAYAVGSEGSVTITDDAGTEHGVLSGDGGMFTIAVTSEEGPGITVGLKRTPAAMPEIPLLLLD
jgi:hypothetical protein